MPITTSSFKIYGIVIGVVGVCTGLLAGLAFYKCRNRLAQEDLPQPYRAVVDTDDTIREIDNIPDIDKRPPIGILPVKNQVSHSINSVSNQLPIGIALSDNKIDLISLDTSNISFDYRDSGIKTKTSWVGSRDAFLVYDHNDNKLVDAAKELVLTKWSETAMTDFEVLKEVFDSNKDNKFNKNDTEFHKFMIWQDKNQDGVSQSFELTSLPDSGLVEIDFNTEEVLQDEFFGKEQDMSVAEVLWKDGHQTLVYDLALETQFL